MPPKTVFIIFTEQILILLNSCEYPISILGLNGISGKEITELK
jgi:hypothetical protein